MTDSPIGGAAVADGDPPFDLDQCRDAARSD